MAKLLKMEGVIEVVARNGKGIKIGEDWYGVYAVKDANGAKKGDTIAFEYEVVKKGGQTFNNIKGEVDILEESEEEQEDRKPAARRGTSQSNKPAAPARVSSEDARQLSIVRQNSLTQANNLAATYYRGSEVTGEIADFAADIVELARIFEQYSMGRDD